MKIPLLYAGNRAVFDGIVISLLSATRYCLYPLDVYLLTMDLRDRDPKFQPLTEEQRAYLEALCRERNSESRVRLIDVGDLYRKTLLHSPNAETGYTPYCFLRLFADCLPELPDKLIYLDTDTLFCDDPLKLYTELVDGYELAGVRDRYGCRFFGTVFGLEQNCGIAFRREYRVSGILKHPYLIAHCCCKSTARTAFTY